MKKFKILLLNLGYCTKLNGSLSQYILKCHRYLFLSRKVQREVLRKLKDTIAKEEPDLVCLVEIKKGKQMKELVDGDYTFFDIENKYGRKSILRKLPFFYNKSNAFLSKDELSYKKYYLKNGVKKLIYEITLPNKTKLVLGHFSLKKNVRAKQFEEICKKYADVESKIICGDFNISKGITELDTLRDDLDLKCADKKPTFPAFYPKKSLDLFLCQRQLNLKAEVLRNQLSDHLPVTLEVEL